MTRVQFDGGELHVPRSWRSLPLEGTDIVSVGESAEPLAAGVRGERLGGATVPLEAVVAMHALLNRASLDGYELVRSEDVSIAGASEGIRRLVETREGDANADVLLYELFVRTDAQTLLFRAGTTRERFDDDEMLVTLASLQFAANDQG